MPKPRKNTTRSSSAASVLRGCEIRDRRIFADIGQFPFASAIGNTIVVPVSGKVLGSPKSLKIKSNLNNLKLDLLSLLN